MSVTVDLLVLYQKALQAALIDRVGANDPLRAGIVKIGALQGEPEPDVARISVTVHPNDPDNLDDWLDEIIEVEMPNSAYWERRFTVKYQLLLEVTGEALLPALTLSSDLKERIEHTILGVSYAALNLPTERVVRGAMSTDSDSHFLQGGGPPDSYNMNGKYRFSVVTLTSATY